MGFRDIQKRANEMIEKISQVSLPAPSIAERGVAANKRMVASKKPTMPGYTATQKNQRRMTAATAGPKPTTKQLTTTGIPAPSATKVQGARNARVNQMVRKDDNRIARGEGSAYK